MNGNLSQVVEDAQRLATAVFDVYRTTAKEYERAIGPIVSPEQQKVVLDVALACIGISNKEQRVEKFREDRKNGHSNRNGHKADAKQDARDVPAMPVTQTPEQKDVPKPETATSGGTPTGQSGYRQRDARDRPTEQLIKELNIKSPAQAGWLRARKEIFYIEWQRVRDYVSQQEVANGGKLASA